MPVSEIQQDYEPNEPVVLAVASESLYLVNLLLLPGVGFILLLLLYWKAFKNASTLSRNHLQQTVFTSLWGGSLIVFVFGLILVLGGIDGPYTWMIAILYFTLIHSFFILCGMIGLIKALAGQHWTYPLVGRLAPKV
jgi:uncharacterized Tic20 family protein